MESKRISGDQSSRYESFIAEKLEAYNKYELNELQGRQIRACFHGWMIMSNHLDNNVMWSIWNPLTSEVICLPPLIHKKGDFYECCLSSPPYDPGSILLLTTTITPNIIFCRLDSKEKILKWSEMSYAKQIRSMSGLDDCFLECPTCYNGKVYAMTTDPYYTFVIQVDIVMNDNEVVISLLPLVSAPLRGHSYTRFPSRNNFCTVRSFLKGSCTELFYIILYFKSKKRIGELFLFKLEMTSKVWEEIEDLKNAMFFLEYASENSHSLFYMYAVTSEIGGYVHILGQMDNIIYSFHAKDRTISLSSTHCIVRESQVLVWAMLECRLEVDHHELTQEEEHAHHELTQEEEHAKDNEIVIRLVKRDKTEFDSAASESHLLNFPFHMLEMVMEHCVGIEYMNFRATCKRCHLAAPLVQWRNKTILRRLQTYSVASPWLMVLDNYQGIITFIDPICGGKYFIKIPEEFKAPRERNNDCEIFCSRYGWLLLVIQGNELVFFNPFTSNMLKLPWSGHCLGSICFSAPPTSPDCVVVGFATGPWHVYIHYMSQKPSLWHKYQLDFGTNDPYSFHFPTFGGGDIYALCNDERIDAFRDIIEEDYSWEIVKDKTPKSCCRSPFRYFLSKCDQHLLYVIVDEIGESVEVFQLNDSTKEWEKLDGLGTHMIYISNTSCICLEARSPQMENKIYFPILSQNKDMKIIFYSLETRMYYTFDGRNIQEVFGAVLFGSKEQTHPHTWIEPSWT